MNLLDAVLGKPFGFSQPPPPTPVPARICLTVFHLLPPLAPVPIKSLLDPELSYVLDIPIYVPIEDHVTLPREFSLEGRIAGLL